MAQGVTEVKTLNYCIDGEWRESATEKYMPVTDSSTGEVFAEAPCCTAGEVDAAIASAHKAFETWSEPSHPEAHPGAVPLEDPPRAARG